jgi:hypothetical protein
VIDSRIRSRRSGAILAATLLIVAAVPGLVTAADTRILWIGAPDLTVDTTPADGIPDNSGKLFPTKVSVPDTGKGPYATLFQVEILNSGGQNLAHTTLTINADVQNLTTLSRATIYDPDGGNDASSAFCTPPTGDVITCDYGSLGAGASRTVAVVVNVSDAYDAAHQIAPLFSATVTTNNENGSNTQTFTATSLAFTVDAFNANSLSTFALDGVSENLSTSAVGGAGGNLNTNVNFNTSNKELVTINEAASTAALYPCPPGLSCQPDYSEVTTTSGSFTTSPFFTWKLTAIVPKTYVLAQGFVAHFATGTTTNDWILYFNDKTALCGTNIAAKIASAGHCIKTLSLTKFDKVSSLLLVEVVMDHQGGMKI